MRKFLAVLCVFALLFQPISAAAVAPELDDDANPNEILKPSADEPMPSAISLDSEKIGQVSSYDRIIFHEEKNGIYFLKTVGKVYSNDQSYELVFYDIAQDTYTTVYQIENMETSFVTSDAVYFADYTSKKESTSDTAEGSTVNIYNMTVQIHCFDLNTQTESSVTLAPISSKTNWAGFLSAVGVDGEGRIYIATANNELHLFDREGAFLSQIPYTGKIRQFYGFDKTNGNFYYEGSYNWVYWGYDHYMSSLMAGNVGEDGSITLPEANLMILYQTGFYDHYSSVQMLNDQYLASLTTFGDDALMILNSNKYDVSDYTEQSTSINMVDSGVSVSVLNIENMDAVQMALYTAASEYANDVDISSVGPRCALSPDGSSLYVKTESNLLTEYGMNKEKKLKLQTAHPVYTFAVTKDACQVIEKEGDTYYLEIISREYPTDFTITAADSLQVGESGKIECSTDSSAIMDYTFESSDPEILHVDENGVFNAWKAGEVTVTVTATPSNIIKKLTVSVKDGDISMSDAYSMVELAGAVSNTIHQPRNYGVYGNTIDAYLTPFPGGGYERVEYVNSKVLVEKYDASLKLVTQTYLECELPMWGSFYSGSEYNFLVFGQKNEKESDDCEVIRVVKYDKNWKRAGACSVKGANTYIPFDAGGCSMTEINGMLYVHTCHEMYKSSDGYHHQANCTFKIQESDMSIKDSYTGVMNLSEGYVSHSFMQIIRTDGKDIYRADLGDAYPRGIALTRTSVEEELKKPMMYANVAAIPGEIGNNYTGYALGGLELSENNYIIAGSGIKSTTDSTANIFVNAGDKDSWNSDAAWITAYDGSSVVKVQPPKLVKLNANQFLLMWEEFDKKTGDYQATKLVLLNPNGELASEICSIPLALSACIPMVNTNGTVSWFVTENYAPKLITINPYQLESVQEKTAAVTLFKPEPPEPETPEQGDMAVVKNQKYKVTGTATVAWIGMATDSKLTISIPASVQINGKKYRVTAISANACKNNKKLKKLVIGSGIQKIGKNAFYGCKNLKSVRIKSKVLKTIGKKAFYKTQNKIKIKIPKTKFKTYKKKLQKSKLPKKAKITS